MSRQARINRISQIKIKEIPDSVPRIQLKYVDEEMTEYEVKTVNVIPTERLVNQYRSIGVLFAQHCGLDIVELYVEKISFQYDDDLDKGISIKMEVRTRQNLQLLSVETGILWSNSGNESTVIPEQMEAFIRDLEEEVLALLSGRRGQLSLFDKEKSEGEV